MKGKFLLAAKRYRRGAHIEYIISLDTNDLSRGSQAYVGKLRYGCYDDMMLSTLCQRNAGNRKPNFVV